MHYRNGTPAKVGDYCRFQTHQWKDGKSEPVTREGLVIGITPGAESCKAQVVYPCLQQQADQDGVKTFMVLNATTTVTLGECDPAT